MNLRTAEAFWLMKNGFINSYPSLQNNIKADVAIVGAGITGALTAYYLAKAGLEVVVLDKRHPGMGSTAASTALLQYEIDEPLHSLTKLVGQKRAELSYLACANALQKLGQLVRQEKWGAHLRMLPSLQYASYKKDVQGLKDELKARKSIGLDVELLAPEEIKQRFSLQAPAALWSKQGGQVDAYALAHALFAKSGPNLSLFDKIEVQQMQPQKSSVLLQTSDGFKVSANYVVIACGYESQKFLPFQVVKLGATYAFASKPLNPEVFWESRALLWETKDPYLYIRTTKDNRIIVGGRDDEHHNTDKRDKALPKKIKGLVEDMQKLLGLNIIPDFAWAGAFGSTKDSLGYAGTIKQLPRVYFNLGYGGNGILYSQIGAEVIRDSILGCRNEYAELFTFER